MQQHKLKLTPGHVNRVTHEFYRPDCDCSYCNSRRRMRKLKVYGIATFLPGVNKQVRTIAACSSMKEFAELLGDSLYHIRDYAAETGNNIELSIAHAKPRTVFYCGLNDMGKASDYKEWSMTRDNYPQMPFSVLVRTAWKHFDKEEK